MNELYKAREDDTPPVPPIISLPNVSLDDDRIYFKRSTGIILIILVGIMMFGIMFFKDYQAAQISTDASTNLKVYCQPQAGNERYNNIQVSHTYNNYIVQDSNLPGRYCIAADDYGSTWGSSMQPTFFEGNSILLKNFTNVTQLKTGDLIRFYRFNQKFQNCTTLSEAIRTGNYSGGGAWINNSMAVIHRINAIYDDQIVAQGDNLYEQEVVVPCQITGIAVGIVFT